MTRPSMLAYNKARYAYLKSIGLCPKCGKVEALRSACAECLAKQRNAMRRLRGKV